VISLPVSLVCPSSASRVAVSSVRAAPFSSTCSTQSRNKSRKLRLRCGCQFPWCSLALRLPRVALPFPQFALLYLVPRVQLRLLPILGNCQFPWCARLPRVALPFPQSALLHSPQSDNNFRKLRFRCGCVSWCSQTIYEIR
jgi:hypothetical protein